MTEQRPGKEFLKDEMVFCATTKGCQMMLPTGRFVHAPVALLPCSFSAELFNFGIKISPIYNNLVNRIARSEVAEGSTWLENTLRATCEADEFTGRLMEIYVQDRKLRKTDPQQVQMIELGILRSDYMTHDENAHDTLSQDKLQQVELNTIAASFGCLSSAISASHRYLFHRYPEKVKALLKNLPSTAHLEDSIPENPILNNLVDAFAKSHKLFKSKMNLEDNENVALLLIVLENEQNSFDQKILEYNLSEKHGIKTIRKSLQEIHAEAKYKPYSGRDNHLVVNGHIISVAYFRAGYAPDHYTSEKDWEARKLVEFSQAIKCPSIGYHLVGTKKVQQKLTMRGEPEKFLSEQNCKDIRGSFTRIFSLDVDEMTEEDKRVLEESRTSDKFVLKPQREGGGNNFYGADVGRKLGSMTEDERKGYILMDRIYPKEQELHLISQGDLKDGKGICELGMFSVILSDDKQVYENKYAGYLLRTKFTGVDEGGVAAGYSSLSSVYLC